MTLRPSLALLLLLAPAALSQAHPRPIALSPSPEAVAALQQGAGALRAGHADLAVAAFTHATEASPRFAEAWLNLGLAQAALAHNTKAAAALRQAVTLKPALRGAHLFLAISEYKLNHLAPAAEAARRETELNSADPQAWLWRGLIELAQQQLETALADLDHAHALDPDNVDILYHRGRAAFALSQQSYDRMFQLDPKSWHVPQVLAEADVEAGKDDEAVKEFEQTIAAAPPQGGLYEALGSAFWRLGRYDEAQHAYETALQLDPDDTVTMYKLGCLRVDRSDAAGGKTLLQQVLAADPTLIETTYYLGRAELQLGNDAAAIADFKQTIAEGRDDEITRQSWFQLSRVYRRLHDIPASNAAQDKFRVLDQQHRDTLQAKVAKNRSHAGRDTSIPAPALDAPADPTN